MTLEMLGMNVLVKMEDAGEKVSKGGIITPGTTRQSSIQKAEVVAVGPGEIQNGNFVPVKDIKAGDTVVIDRDFTKAIDNDGEEQYIVSYRDVLGKSE